MNNTPKLEFCHNCKEWVKPNWIDDGYPTDRGWYEYLVKKCPNCSDETGEDGPRCTNCDTPLTDETSHECDECKGME